MVKYDSIHLPTAEFNTLIPLNSHLQVRTYTGSVLFFLLIAVRHPKLAEQRKGEEV